MMMDLKLVTGTSYQAAKSEVRMPVYATLRLRTRVNVVKLICFFCRVSSSVLFPEEEIDSSEEEIDSP